jgi:ribosomal protein S12 methylthiotransferase
MTKVNLLSLGCAKNLIDSEIMLGCIRKAGMDIVEEAVNADVVIINTCSFIDIAKQESIQALYDAIDERAEAMQPQQKIIAAGCLTQRFRKELPKLIPEVDAFIGLDQVQEIVPIIKGLLASEEKRDFVTPKSLYIPDYDTPRYRLTPKHTAYVKIAEGCNHTCSFCAIPSIRGRHRSRSQESIVREVKQLVADGVKEINLISQDTTYYGMDLWEGERAKPRSGVDSSKGASLATLLHALNGIDGDFWVRLLYTHPAHWSDELICAIAECGKVVKYVDIPLQHIADSMLDRMHRETDGAYIRDLLQRMRKGIQNLAIRTTFIVGFPGETQEDFDELLEFMKEEHFERSGVFNYSREEGTRAYKYDEQVHHMRRKSRERKANQLIQQLARETSQSLVGKKIKVLVDSPGTGRTQWDAPEVDGTVIVDESIPVGSFAYVTVKDFFGYDLVSE